MEAAVAFFEKKLKLFSKVEAIASALLYMEYRINYNSKRKDLRSARYTEVIQEVYQSIDWEDIADTIPALAYRIAESMQINGWESFECIIDSMDLKAGKSGAIPFTLKASLANAMKTWLEEEIGIPVTKIIREAKGEH